MSIKTIIFDLDGTLIDSSLDITNALNYAMEPYSLKRLAWEDTVKLVGEGISRLIEKIAGDLGETGKADVAQRFIAYYTEHVADYTRAYPGVRETLEGLVRYRKAVISNKRESLSKLVLQKLGLLRYFSLVIGSDTTTARKPSPIPVLKALAELEAEPGEAVMVGDSDFDVDAGRAAGVTTVAVTYGYRPRAVIAYADFLIDRMSDLLPLVEKMDR